MNQITKQDLQQKYIVENKTRKQCAVFFGVCEGTIKKYIRQYNLVKDKQQYISLISKTKHNKLIFNRPQLDFSKIDLYNLYIEKNYTSAECAKYFKCSVSFINTKLKEFNISKPKIFITQADLYQKFIVENLTGQECAKYFGVSRGTITRWAKKYNIIKGKEQIFINIQNTFNSNYGCNNPFANKLIQEKIKQTNLEKYGVEYSCLRKECREALFSTSSNSNPNLNFAAKLEANNIIFSKEKIIDHYSYDFLVNNTLIEVNPSITHNITMSPFPNKKPIDKEYHSKKTMAALEKGYHCIHIFDWDDPDKIIRTFLLEKEIIYARKCDIKLVNTEEEKMFINENHLQGYVSSKICVGLYYKDELISIMSFGKPRYNKHYQYELLRYCSKYNVIGGAKKLFSFFIKTYKPENILSYCDLSKFSGDVYIKLGFKKKSVNIGKHWYSPKLKKHITDNLLRQQGFDRLLGDIYGKFGKGTNNSELMIKHGFLEIYDAGQVTYIYDSNKNNESE